MRIATACAEDNIHAVDGVLYTHRNEMYMKVLRVFLFVSEQEMFRDNVGLTTIKSVDCER